MVSKEQMLSFRSGFPCTKHPDDPLCSPVMKLIKSRKLLTPQVKQFLDVSKNVQEGGQRALAWSQSMTHSNNVQQLSRTFGLLSRCQHSTSCGHKTSLFSLHNSYGSLHFGRGEGGGVKIKRSCCVPLLTGLVYNLSECC